MYRGVYIALSGAVLGQDHLDVITHNLANANTAGFKRERLSFRDFLLSRMTGVPDPADGRIMTEVGAATVDLSTGNLVRTGNPLDVALDGQGFIALEGGRYTRKGDLQIDRDGWLRTRAGLRLLGEDGRPIRLPQGKVEIAPTGEIRVDGEPAGSIRVVDFPDPSALKGGAAGQFTAAGEPRPARARVVQGHLETANVNVIQEMVLLVAAMREFETYQKAIHAFDEAASKVNNDLARI